jgi:uncharacterized membrane protein
MPGAKYFLSLGGSFLLGLAVLIVAALITWLLWPYIMPLFMFLAPYVAGAAMIIVVFIIIAIIIYFITMFGVLLQYLFKPMKVSKVEKGYNIATIKESGLREKGETKSQVRKVKKTTKTKKNKSTKKGK